MNSWLLPRWAQALVLVVIVGLAGGSARVITSQSDAAHQTQHTRFLVRVDGAGAELGAIITASTASSNNITEDDAAMRRTVTETRAAYAFITTNDGTVVARSTPAPDALVAARQVDGHVLGDLVVYRGGLVVDQRTLTARGHFLVVGVPAEALAVLVPFLTKLVSIPAQSYMEDGHGLVIASNQGLAPGRRAPVAARGSLVGRSAVPGTPWHLVIAVRAAALDSAIPSLTADWVLLAAFVLTALVILDMTRKLGQGRALLLARNEELCRYTEALISSNAELEGFAYAASHDLQQPLRMISSYTELLTSQIDDRLNADERENFGFVQDGAEKMSRVIGRLLEFSRLSRVGELETFDVREVIDGALADLGGVLHEANVTVTVDETCVVTARRTQLRQALRNLISNAVKYRRPDAAGGPVIALSAERSSDGEVQVRCRDNGIGIAEEHFARIFNMGIGSRLHREDEYEGSGIGLALVKKIAQVHGGSVSVKSKVGQCSTFTLRLSKDGKPNGGGLT